MFCGTAMILYDGSPFYPSPEVFLKAVLETGVTAYGGSPRFFSELQNRGVKPREFVDLRRLKVLLSTGALLTPAVANYLADAFGPVCQINFTGGTELCGNFMNGIVTQPSYAGECAVRELGMDVVALGKNGKIVKDARLAIWFVGSRSRICRFVCGMIRSSNGIRKAISLGLEGFGRMGIYSE